MSAVEVIAAALAAGASVGMKDTASAAVKDAYTAFKELLADRLGGHDNRIVQALQADATDPSVWQASIGDALTDSGAAADAHIVDAAQRLLVAADPDKAHVLNIKVDTNYGAVGEFRAPITFNQGPPVPPSPPAVG